MTAVPTRESVLNCGKLLNVAVAGRVEAEYSGITIPMSISPCCTPLVAVVALTTVPSVRYLNVTDPWVSFVISSK